MKILVRRVLVMSIGLSVAFVAAAHAQARAEDSSKCLDRDPDTAIAGCSALIDAKQDANTDLVTAYKNRAAARSRKRDSAGAVADYSTAISLSPNTPALYVSRGLAKRTQGNLDAAIADYTKAIELDPANATPYVSRGFANADKGAFAEAIVDYGRALDRNPNYAFAFADRGVARSALGELAAAIADLTRALEINPKYAFAYVNRGNVKRAQGNAPGALDDYLSAIAADSHFASAYLNLGILKAASRDFDGAIAAFRQAIAADASTETGDQASLYLWITRARRGERDEATVELRKYMARGAAEHADAWAIARAKFLLGELDENGLMNAARSPTSLLPALVARHSAQAHFLAGAVQMLRGNTSRAADGFRGAIAEDHTPDSPSTSATAELNALLRR